MGTIVVGICCFVTRHSRLSGVNQLDGYAASSGTPGTPGQLPLTSFRTLPAKSNLKRRLTDCMESDESRGNVDEPLKKKRNIQFDAVTVYYFPRAQGFTCVPSQVSGKIGFSLPSSFLSARNLCATFAIRLPFLPFTSVSWSPRYAYRSTWFIERHLNFHIFSFRFSGRVWIQKIRMFISLSFSLQSVRFVHCQLYCSNYLSHVIYIIV